MEYGFIGLVVLILDIVAIISALQSNLEPLMKLVWVIVILALPVVGMLLYFVMNPRKLPA